MVTLRPPRQLLLEVAADFGALARVREQLRAFLVQAGIEGAGCDDLLLVATELCTNAIEATDDRTPVEMSVSFDGRALRLQVANVAAGRVDHDAAPELCHGSLQERGRGLAIVRSLVDTMAMDSTEGRTVVRTMQLV
jgi:anti-sigma regulatory factor (Ser/Thr protein kinase)